MSKQQTNDKRQQLLKWFQQKLQQRSIKIQTLGQLSTGNNFVEVLFLYHPRAVDLTKLYIKPENKFKVLQNYKQLLSVFTKLGWKKFDPERYSKEQQKDYLALAGYIKKNLQSNQLHLEFNFKQNMNSKQSIQKQKEQNAFQEQIQLNQFGTLNMFRQRNAKVSKTKAIMELQKVKQDLLNRITQIQIILQKQVNVQSARQKILQIVSNAKN